jgi:protein N-terminal methyltransferase
LQNDTIIAVSLGEEYAGSTGTKNQHAQNEVAQGESSENIKDNSLPHPSTPPPICGRDDMGRFYASLNELWIEQQASRAAFYAANSAWWDDGGYNGSSDEAAMIGDDHSEADAEESSKFLDRLLRDHGLCVASALDAGAGVGRVTKHVLLKRCGHVHLVEACETWSKQSKRYLGKKRALSCTFTNERLEEFTPKPDSYDLIWVQWTLQYLIDQDVIRTLKALKVSLRKAGLMVLKENRPYLPETDHEQFQMDTPGGEHGRYDITRPDAHHRQLFEAAGLTEILCERGEETNTWVLK